jgi:hypothetical protein
VELHRGRWWRLKTPQRDLSTGPDVLATQAREEAGVEDSGALRGVWRIISDYAALMQMAVQLAVDLAPQW